MAILEAPRQILIGQVKNVYSTLKIQTRDAKFQTEQKQVILVLWLCFSFFQAVEVKSESGNRNSSSKLVLYSYWQSSCAWRVHFALILKGLSYEYKAVDLLKGEQFSPEFERLNPLHYVPVLVDGDVVISDSFAILLYLEEKYPEKPLLPKDPQKRTLNLQAASIVSSSIQPFNLLTSLKYLDEKLGPEERLLWAKSSIEKGFLALEKLLQDFAGTYGTGAEVNMVDVFLAPQIAVAVEMCKVDMTKFPTLNRLFESYKALPEFIASTPERQPDAVH